MGVLVFGSKYVGDEWFETKFLVDMIFYEKTMMMMIQQRSDYITLSPSDVLATFVTNDLMSKTSEKSIARAQGTKRANIALKANKLKVKKYSEGERDEEPSAFGYLLAKKIEYMDLSSRRFFAKKNTNPNNLKFSS